MPPSHRRRPDWWRRRRHEPRHRGQRWRQPSRRWPPQRRCQRWYQPQRRRLQPHRRPWPRRWYQRWYRPRRQWWVWQQQHQPRRWSRLRPVHRGRLGRVGSSRWWQSRWWRVEHFSGPLHALLCLPPTLRQHALHVLQYRLVEEGAPLVEPHCCTCKPPYGAPITRVEPGPHNPGLCSVVVLARCAVRHAPVRLLELQCCTCVQSQSPALALLRRRARWIRAAPRLLPGVHPPVLCCTTCSHFPRGRGPRRRARWLAFGHWLVARCSIPR